jgi:23S rRNA (uridine2552-2'-O)-methyltransferase
LKKNKVSKNWLNQRKKDIFFEQSKTHGYKSRSAFKLIEMNEKFKFLKIDSCLVDLGSSPGGWCQVAAKKITKGKILAVDIKNMEKQKNVDFIIGDMNNVEVQENIINYFGKKIDVVISDMAANTSGNKNLDTYRTGELCLNAMNLAQKILIQKGVFIAKLFMGSIFKEIKKKAEKSFKNVIMYKPLSSKKESKEVYIYCKGIL